MYKSRINVILITVLLFACATRSFGQTVAPADSEPKLIAVLKRERVKGIGSALFALAMESFAENIGLAFQVTDDILSVTATSEELGKRSGRDERGVNFATLFGLDAARELAGELVTTAIECLALFGDRAQFLRTLARFVLERRR